MQADESPCGRPATVFRCCRHTPHLRWPGLPEVLCGRTGFAKTTGLMRLKNLTTKTRTGRFIDSSCCSIFRGPLLGLWLLPWFSGHAAVADAPADPIWVEGALNGIAELGGDWVNDSAIGSLTWGRVVLSGLVLLLLVVSAEMLRWILRILARRQRAKASLGTAAEPPKATLLELTLEALMPPLRIVLWAWGLDAAVALLLPQPMAGSTASFVHRLSSWLKDVTELAGLLWWILRMIRVVESELRRWTSRTESKWDDVLVVLVVRALRLIVPLAGLILFVPTLDLPARSHALFSQAAGLALIFAVGYILYQLVNALEEAVVSQFRMDVKDNLEARKVSTQVKVLKKVAVIVIVIFTGGSMLMVFDSVRQLGTSILASAGVLGIIVGFAAQRSLATMLAGLQIALTQPIRLDDVVIVENEWGRVEEISLTYVVVVIWDQRRLIVPINYFIEKPFQNWTRVSADLLGSVFLYVDYTVPLKALRDQLDRLLENSTRWDRRVKVIQVTDAKPDGMELRVLVSAADAGTAWDLRCELREKLVDFLQQNYPQCLPRLRAELVGPTAKPQSVTG